MTKILLVITMVLLSACGEGQSLDSIQQDRQDEFLSSSIPKGSIIIEQFHSKKVGYGSYVIYKFRKQCFMMYGYYRRGGLTNITCPKEMADE